MKKNWLMFVEPYSKLNEPVYKIIHKDTAIKQMLEIAEAKGKPYKDNEDALNDFIAVNWATKCVNPNKLKDL